MTGKGTVREALALRIVIGAELKRLSGSRPKRGRGAGAGSFNGYPPHAWSPPVDRGALPPSVQLVERGKPDSLSGAVQGVSPWSRPSASEGKGGAGKRCGKKRMSLTNGVDRGSTFAPPERELTSCRCDRTKKTQQTVNRGSVSNE
jgi:hypothetical protein